MSVEVERDALLGALQQVVGVVEARNTIPVLSNLLLVVAEGTVTVTATDLDIEASASAPAAGEMRTTLPSNKLMAAVKSFKPGRIAIVPIEGRQAVTLKQGRGVRIISTLPATDFPKREPLENVTSFMIRASALARLLGTCGVAQCNDETRYYLNGVFFHVSEGLLRAAATDGHRLVRCEVALPAGADKLNDFILPRKAVAQLLQLIKRDGEVWIHANDKAASFQIGGTTLLTKLVDHTYPDYSRVIPPVSGNLLSVAREALTTPVASVAAIVNAEGDRQKVRAVAFDLCDTEAGNIEVSAKDTAGSSASEPVEATYAGTPMRFGVNSQYLRDVAGIFTEDGTLSLSLADAASPLRLTCDKDPDLVAVVMPMRVP